MKGYLKLHLPGVILFLVFSCIFTGVFALYHLQAEAVLYAAALCAAIGIIALTISFIRYRRKLNQLKSASENITVSLDTLPKPSGEIEELYHSMTEDLFNSINSLSSQSAASKAAMEDYYAMWVHQIKVPISAMHLLLDDQEKNSPLRIELFKIEQYVEMVLSYARLGSDSNDFVFKKISLDKVVRQSVRKYAPLFISKKLAVEIGNIEIQVTSDEKWLSFVIEQILSNSLKYTKKGKVSIYIIEPAVLVIEDTGIGIAAEDLHRIGERGFTGYNGRIYKKSTGLGLYLCKEILKRLSHTIRFESEPDKGTRVYIGLNRQGILEE